MTEINAGGWSLEPESGRQEIEMVPAEPDLEWCDDFTVRFGGRKRAKLKVENCFVERESPAHQQPGLTRSFDGEYFGEFVDGRIIRAFMMSMPETKSSNDEADDEDEEDEPRMVEVPHLLLDQVLTNVEPLTHRKEAQVMVEVASLQEIEIVDQYEGFDAL